MIKKVITSLGFIIMLVTGTTGMAQAETLTASWFLDGFDADTGMMWRDPTVLVVTFVTGGEVEQFITPDFEHFGNAVPAIDFWFGYDQSSIVFVPGQDIVKMAVMKDMAFDDVTSEVVASLTPTYEIANIALSDIGVGALVFWTSEKTCFKLGKMESYPGELDTNFELGAVVPEPGTLLLLGLGLLGLVGFSRRKKMLAAGSSSLLVMLFFSASLSFAGEYRHSYTFQEPDIVTLPNGRQIVEVEEAWQNDSTPGTPLLPVRTANMFIPSDEEIMSIHINHSALQPIEGVYTLQHAVTPYPISYQGGLVLDEPDADIYTTDANYPAAISTERGTQHYRGVQIVRVDLAPVVYNPVQGRVQYYPEIEVVVVTKMMEILPIGETPFRNLSSDREKILNTVDNKDDFLQYSQKIPEIQPLTSRQYVVITTQEMVSAFQQLTNYRQTAQGGGFTTHIETIDQIESNYSGIDLAEKVRNFIRGHYQNYGAEYVILGGDCDGLPDEQIIPTRGCFVEAGSYTDEYIPSDLYFGCLDGNWNGDGDSRWCEPTDGAGGGDIDWFSELYVGRIAADNPTEAANQITKIIAFETSNPAEKTLLVGEKLDPTPTWGGDRLDWVYSYMGSTPKTELYDRNGTWSSSELLSLINTNEHSWLNHLGHSDVTYNMKLSNSSIASMSNAQYMLIYSQGCYSGSTDSRSNSGSYYNSDCFGEEVANAYDDRGAFAYIGNSRYGWYNPGSYVEGASNLAHKEFAEAIFTDGYSRIGAANQESKHTLNLASWIYRWIAFETNLLGDPATPLFSSQAALLVKKAGTGAGTVASAPDGIHCGDDCEEVYAADTVVTLTATPDADSSFALWTGCDSVSGSACTVTMNAMKTVTAEFNPLFSIWEPVIHQDNLDGSPCHSGAAVSSMLIRQVADIFPDDQVVPRSQQDVLDHLAPIDPETCITAKQVDTVLDDFAGFLISKYKFNWSLHRETDVNELLYDIAYWLDWNNSHL